ncbi:MAG TPA: hypothetical protein VMW76_03380 [Bacteroidales bacterium]|nr:hypothetical protein [Bacteroidales bacterium]
MKRTAILLIFLTALVSCKKQGLSPEGPSDIRVINLTDSDFTELYVNTGDGEHTYGNLAAYDTTEYIRFNKAFPEAEISCKVNGVSYTSGVPDNTYAAYVGQGKFSYKVWSPSRGVLDMDIVAEAPLDDK